MDPLADALEFVAGTDDPPLARMEYESVADGDWVESAESTLEISGVSSFGRDNASATTFAFP